MDKTFYVRTDDGSRPVKRLIDKNDGTHAERVEAYPPHKLLTDGDGPNARLRVDVGQTGFFAGRIMYAYYKINLAVASSVQFKFIAPCDFILYGVSMQVRQGGAMLQIFEPGSTTETGAFSTPVVVHLANAMSERPTPFYTPQVTIFTGGTFTGGDEVDYLEAQTASQQVSASSIVEGLEGERGNPAATYYSRLSPLSGVNDTTLGVLRLAFEERV